MAPVVDGIVPSSGAAPQRVKLVFGMTSATEPPAAIEQLIDTLGGRPVVLHHDYGKQPGFRVDRPNVHFTDEHHVTGWGSWTLCLAVLSTIRYALDHLDFDYFQLLSPSCLPLRPVDEFEAHLAHRTFDGSMDLIRIESNEDFMMNYGWRMFAPRGSLRQRVLRGARAAYFGRDAVRVQPFGLAVLSDRRGERSAGAAAYKRLAVSAVRLLGSNAFSGAPFTREFPAYVGSLWFGASRALCEEIVRGAADPRVSGYFSRLFIPDEMLFATLVGNSGRRIAPAYHLINTFNDRGSPRMFKPGDLDTLLASDAWFARKFPGNPDAPVRTGLIARRALTPAAAQAVAPATRGAAGRGRYPRVVFGTMAGAADAPSVAALARSLDGRPLIVHGAPGAAPLPTALGDNVDRASTPLTGGFRPSRLNAGLLHLLKYLVECVDFDYVQLLPPGALPVRPIDEFESFVANASSDAHARVLRLRDPGQFARYASQVCLRPGSRLAPLLRGAASRGAAARDPERPAPGTLTSHAAAALLPICYRALRGSTPGIGSPWFGASREVCQHLVRFATERRWVDYATAIDDDGTVLFATLLVDNTFTLGPPNLASEPLPWLAPGDLSAPALSTGAAFAWFAFGGSADPLPTTRADALPPAASFGLEPPLARR